MEEQEKQTLLDHYRHTSEEELRHIYQQGTLTECASQCLEQVLQVKGVSLDELAALKLTPKSEPKQDERLASLMDRFTAQILDQLLAVLILITIAFAMVFIKEDLRSLLAGLAYLAYLLLSDGLPGGQSLGKKCMNIAVVSSKSGKPCTVWESLLRNVTLVFLGIIDVVFIFGEKRKRLGDYLAATEVIRGKA